MAIQSNLSVAPIDLAAASTDTTLVAAVTGTNRQVITAMSIFNTTSGAIAVDIYESPNTTSSSGKKIASYTVDGNASVDVVELIGQGLSVTQNIIGRVTTGGATLGQLNCKRTTTLYTAGS